MSRIAKLLERIRNNPKQVSFHELQTLLLAFGFTLRGSGGSHHVFVRQVAGRKVRLVIPYRQPHVKVAYVKDTLELIDQIESESSQNDTEQNS
jgi:hypothetical protein